MMCHTQNKLHILWTLFKKQGREAMSLSFQGNRQKKKKTRRSPLLAIGITLLVLYVVAVSFYLIFSLADTLCATLISAGLDFLYFAIFGIVALALGVLVTAFFAKQQLYEAKDNESLLSMPIRPSLILASRLLFLYAETFVLSALVLLPAFIVYMLAASPSLLLLLNFAVLLLACPLLSLAVSCILGYLIALIASKMRNQSIAAVVLTLLFIFGYFYLYAKMYDLLGYILANGETVAERLRQFLYPYYQMGLAASGSMTALAIFTLISFAAMALVTFVLSVSFIRIATANRGTVRREYHAKAVQKRSPLRALFSKEVEGFLKRPAYLLNCGLGSLFLLVAAIAAIIKADALRDILPILYPGMESILPIILCGVLAFMVIMNAVTAPSISLEAHTLWLLQSLPIDMAAVLRVKVLLHLAVSAPFALFAAVTLTAVLGLDTLFFLLVPLTVLLFLLFGGLFGLVCNLRFPNMLWTNEIAAVKQSMSVLVNMLAQFAVISLIGVLYYALHTVISAALFLALVSLLLTLAIILLCRLLRGWGVRRLESF